MKKTRCPHCGHSVNSTSKFCTYCGKQMNGKKKKNPLIPLLIAIVVVLLLIVIVGIILITKKGKPSSTSNTPTQTSIPNPEDYESAEDYYADATEIVSIIDVSSSSSIKTLAETTANLEHRGFTQAPISGLYTMDGELIWDEDEVDASASCPTYETYFTTADGSLWVIYEINGQVMAYPVSYVYEHSDGKTILLSETETLMSYDSETNRFFETIPDPSVIIVIVVDKLDAESLNEFTTEVLDSYVK